MGPVLFAGAPMEYAAVGWREWITFPDFGGIRVKAKVDTGARTSSIHATAIEHVARDGRDWIDFCLFPHQNNHDTFVKCSAPMVERRVITDSGGHAEDRFVVLARIGLGAQTWDIELSLTQRDTMGFRMLLGRTAIRNRFVVLPGKSYLAGAPLDAGFRSQDGS